ncbi:MAG: DUF6801 domain-containing protein [Streptosporangiaceae bacterium]
MSSMCNSRLRGVGRTAVASVIFLATGLLAGTASGAVGATGAASTVAASTSATLTRVTANQSVRLALAYACQFPSGNNRVNVVVAAALPVTATAGQHIQPSGVQITAVLPEPAVSDLRKLSAATVGGSATLAMTETYLATSAPADWQASTPAAAALPATGSLQLAAAGTAPAVATATQGTVTFSVGRLVLELAPRTAGGATTSPATVPVACTPASGASKRLASVRVNPAAASKRPARHRLKLPKGCGHIKVVGTGAATCGYITGYSDVRKLYGAALLQPKRGLPALVNVAFGERAVFKPGKLIEYSVAELYYRGRHELPPIRATFLAFGFVPVTATLGITELTPIRIVSVSGTTAPPYPITVHATSTVSISISKVDVNGVPLAVGPHCRPARSVRLALLGTGHNTVPQTGFTVESGGPLTGMLTIPPFTGCGVTENLDALLTGSISGPRNFVEMTQGKLCGPAQPQNWTCPPPVPKPIH